MNLLLMGMVTIDWGLILLLIIAPLVSALAQLALSRTREYAADLSAARLTGDPRGLAAALAKIEQAQGARSLAVTHPPAHGGAGGASAGTRQ